MFTILLSEEEYESVSREDVNNKLRQKEFEESQKLVKLIAGLLGCASAAQPHKALILSVYCRSQLLKSQRLNAYNL